MIVSFLKEEIVSKLRLIRSKIPVSLLSIFDSNFSVLFLESEIAFNYFALGMREVVNRTISELSNREQVRNSEWFPSYGTHGDDPKKISTKQLLANIVLKEHSMDVLFKLFPIDNSIDALCEMMKKLSFYVHLSLRLDSDQITDELENVIIICGGFFETLSSVQKEIEDLVEITEEGVFDDVLSRTIQELDEIATHYGSPDVEIDKIVIQELLEESSDGMKVNVLCQGRISSELQYGSDADQTRDEGATMNIEFPLEAVVELVYARDGGELMVMEVNVVSVDVDNSSWYDE